MLILRPVNEGDLDDLVGLAKMLDSMNLPADSEFLVERIALSGRSFRSARGEDSLDWREARRVQRELDHIRGEEARMRARHDGRLWDRDRLRLEARLDELSDHIRWLRHNDERRPW